MAPSLDRAGFPVTGRWAYLNHAGVAPLPLASVEAMHATALEAAADGSMVGDTHLDRIEVVRGQAARVLGVPTADLAFVKNTTEGLGFVANGLTWHEGDRVVVPDLEFPSTLFPWLALRDRGVVVDLVAPRGPERALPTEAFAEVIAAGPPPKVVATSWVQFGRGWRTDLAALAALTHDAGALLCADVIQGVGVIPAELDAWGVDFAMADGHKWLLGPEGVGVLYVRGEHLDRLRPLEPGWASVVSRDDADSLEMVLDPDARRLEGGTPNVVGTVGLGASLGLLLDTGIDRIWGHVDTVCDRLVDELPGAGLTVVSDRSEAGRSGIVTATLDDGRDPQAVVEALRGSGVVCAARGGGIRIAPHAYNTDDDVDALLDGLGTGTVSPPGRSPGAACSR